MAFPFCFVILKRLEEPPKKGLKNGGKSIFHRSSHWWNVSSSSSIIQAVFIGELPVAPGEICILIYLSYILYITKFFIPLQWPHASFMGSSAVFAGQIQTHFTRHAAATAAARLFHLGCVEWMKNSLSSVVNFFFFTPHTTKFFFGVVRVKTRHLTGCPPTHFLSSSLLWFVLNFENCKRSISLTWKGCFVEDEWLTQLGEYGNCVLMLPTGRVESRWIYLWSSLNKTSSSRRQFLRK